MTGGAADFEDCTGSYRISACYPDGWALAFSDNAGMMRWYIREGNCPPYENNCPPRGHFFYASLAEAAPEDRTPDYASIMQFLYTGGIYGTGTPFRGVRRSEPGKYYIVENGRLTEKSKNLKPLEDLSAGEDALEEQTAQLAKAVAGCGRIACTITGGTDSRIVLSHMHYQGMRPILDITGPDSHPDVIIARKIAERLGLELIQTNDLTDEENWLEEAIRGADGMTGVCGVYRLTKKARRLRELGIPLECGGLAGELYKNDFIRWDFPFYGGRPNWNHFLRYVVLNYDFPGGVCGEALLPELEKLPDILLSRLASHSGKTKLGSYLSAGHEVMYTRLAGICAMNCRHYTQYSPLMERRVAAASCRRNPHAMETMAWQRGQVTHYCPEIKDFETTGGMTCDSHVRLREYLRFKKSTLRSVLACTIRRNKVRTRRDSCLGDGLSSPQFYAALERCRELGILAPNVEGSQLPVLIADRMFALGTVL